MRSAVVAMALMGVVGVVSAAEPSLVGCFKAESLPESMKLQETDKFNSRGSCRDICVDHVEAAGDVAFAAMGLANKECWCGQKLPLIKLKVAESFCKQGCPGIDTEKCGDRLGDYFSVYTTGEEEHPDEEEPKPSTTSTTASKTSTSEKSESEETTSSTSSQDQAASATASTTPPAESETEAPPPGVNKAAVAAGCVVAVLAIIGISVGAFLFMRKRRRQKVEEDFRRSAAVREFSQKPASDHRLDPGMVQRRDSVGSIADNQDYSRRILKVTNPDGN